MLAVAGKSSGSAHAQTLMLSNGAPRARRGERRQAVLDVVEQHPDGVTRGEILNLMGVKGNKSGEQSVSNALMALAKQTQLGRREGKYVPAA
jgi:alkylation response protein AidB-like acyl-CoA dehydrogenase